MKRFILIFCLLSSSYIHAQITSNTSSSNFLTNYTNGIQNDTVFVFCDENFSPIGELTATPSGGGSNLDFHWEIFDPVINGFVFLLDDLGQSTSTINNLDNGGYKVTIKDYMGNTLDCFRAWVFIDHTTIDIDTILPGCTPFDLNATIETVDYTYYNAPSHPFVIDANTEITVCFDAVHSYVSDLGFYLIGPPSCGSPRIELMPNPGQVNSGDNVCNDGNNVNNFCFSTTATQAPDICRGGPLGTQMATPLTGTWASSDPWNAIFGCDATLGGWKVQIYDCINLDIGNLTGARITFSGNSDCGPNPTVVIYDSGVINSQIKDNSCDPASASIYEVPFSFATPLIAGNQYGSGNGSYFEWTCSDPTVIIADKNALNTTATPTKKRNAWFYFSAIDSLGHCANIDSMLYVYKAPNAPVINPVLPQCLNSPEVNLSASTPIGTWSGNGITDPINGVFDPLDAGVGTHDIFFEDPDICGGLGTTQIIVHEIPTLSLSRDTIICAGGDAELIMNISEGTAPYDITINSGSGIVYQYNGSANSRTEIINPIVSDFYYSPAVTDNNGCSTRSQDTISININPTPNLSVIGDTTICRGDSALLTFNMTGTPLFNVQYNDVNGNTTLNGLSDGAQLYFKPNDSTIYTFNYIIDGGTPQCDTTYNIPIEVNVNPLPTAWFSGDTIICLGDTASIRLRRTGVNPINLTYNDGTNNIVINNLIALDTIIKVWPTAQTNYTITDIVYNNDVACPQIINSSVNVDIQQSPTSSLSGQLVICEGNTVDLIVNSDGTPPFDIVFFDGVSDVNMVIANNGATIPVTPSSTTTYILKQLTDVANSVCPNYIHDSLTIVVNKPPRAFLKDYLCNSTSTAYQVVIDLFDGNENYVVIGPPAGNIVLGGPGDTTRFISDPIPTGDPFSFDVDDTNGCGPITIAGIKACDCISDAGTMDLTPLSVCINLPAIAFPNNDHITDPNDSIIYVLHEGPNNTLVNVIDSSTTPQFNFNPATMLLETTYYISTVVGDSLITDPAYVNQGHICTSVAIGVPVVFHDIPTMQMTGDTTICNGATADLNFTLTGKSPYVIDYNGWIQGPPNFNRAGSGKESVGPLYDTTYFNTISITDDNNCVITQSETVTINVNPIPTTTLSSNKLSYCNGESVYLVFTNTGNGPWNITYKRGNSLQNFSTSKLVDSILIQDTVNTRYELIQVADNTQPSCIGTNQSYVDFVVNPIPTAVLVGSTAICEGDTTQIMINTSGNSPYIIDIDDEASGFTINTLTDGNIFEVHPSDTTTYTITNIQDGSSPTCSSNLTSAVTIDVNPLPTLVVTALNDTICEGDSTLFTLTITKDSPFDIYYNNGTTTDSLINVADGYSFYVSPLTNTDYNFTQVTDNNIPLPACSIDPKVTKKVVVYERPYTIVGQDIEICEGDDGLLPINITGVNGLFSLYYNINSGITEVLVENLNAIDTLVIPNLPPGTFDIGIKSTFDNSSPKNCITYQSDVVTIQVNPTPALTISGDKTVCDGDSVFISFDFVTGIPNFDVTLADGIGNSHFLNNINSSFIYSQIATDSSVFTISNFTDLTNAQCDGVWDNDPVIINVNPIPSVSFTGNDTICYGTSAELNLNASGVELFTYSVATHNDNLEISNANKQSTYTVSPTETTTYTLYQIADGSNNTCYGGYQGEVTITVRPLPVATISGEKEVCFGNNVSLYVDINGVGPFDLAFENNNGDVYNETLQPNQNTYELQLPVGEYEFDLVDVTMSSYPFCSAPKANKTGVAKFRIDPIPLIDIDVLNGKTCSPVFATFVNNSQEDVYSCTWTLSNGMTFNSCLPEYKNLGVFEEGSYDLTFHVIAPLSTRCSDTLHLKDAIIVYPDPIVEFKYSPNPITIEDNLVQFYNETTNAYTSAWRILNDSLEVIFESTQTNPRFNFPNLDEAKYIVELTETSEHTCQSTKTSEVIVNGVLLVNIPNSFTPNDDGANDRFGPVVFGAYRNQDFSFTVYNRWGEILFDTNNYGTEKGMWDGTYKSQNAPEGTYVYKLVVRSLYSDKFEEFNGNFSLIR